MSRSKRRATSVRGLAGASGASSVVELLVAAGVLLVVLTVALQILLGVNRFQKRAQVSYELNQQTLAGLTGLTRDLAGSTQAATQIKTSPRGVIMIAGTLDGTVYKWNRLIAYFLQPDGQGGSWLMRSELGIEPTETAPPTDGKNFSDFPAPHVVARDVNELDVAKVGALVNVTLKCGRVEMNQNFSVTVNVTVPFLN